MESAIFLRYCPLPGVPLHLSYGSKVSQKPSPKNFHLRFNHATPLCLPHFSTTRRPFRHANCMLERFSVPPKNDGSDNKILRGVTGVSVVLACVLGLFNFGSMTNPRLSTACGFPSSSGTVDDMGTGKKAFRSLFQLINANYPTNVKPSLPYAKRELSDLDVKKLKSHAIALSKSGKGAAAVQGLEKQYNYCKQNDQSSTSNVGVAFVELLMFQEKFEEARKRLDEQIDRLCPPKPGETLKPWERLVQHYEKTPHKMEEEEISRFLLYKAIVHTMLEDNKEAKEWWKAFIKIFD